MENKLAIICGKFDVGGIFFSSKGTTHERSHPQWIVLELQLSVPAQLFFLFSWSFVMHIEKKFHFSKRIFAQTYVWLPLLCRIYEHVKKHAFKCLEYPKELNVEKLHQCYNFRRAITMLASHSKCAFFFSIIHPSIHVLPLFCDWVAGSLSREAWVSLSPATYSSTHRTQTHSWARQ